MNKSTDKSETATFLRQKAEESLREKPVRSLPLQSEAQTLRLIHELEVYQIELEMQNEELILATKKAELAAEKHAALYDFAPTGYFTLTNSGEIMELNLCGAQMLGKTRKQLIRSTLGVFISDDSKVRYKKFLTSIFKYRAKECCEISLLANDNTTVPVLLSCIASDNGEQCFLTMTDISERKKAEEKQHKYEERIRQTQKLEALGVLAGGIAHDFNNLMGGVFGYIEMATDASSESKVILYLSKASVAIDRARALTRQLLTFAKGGAPVQKIGYLFPFVHETAQFALSGANVACHCDVQPGLWACNFDKNQIGQVIDNLIINAHEAMRDGGTIELTAGNITLAEKEHPSLAKGNYVKISIKDYGVGIPKEIIAAIFDPFFTTKKKGHGLGLATCYSIINRHGGCIDVESEPGNGSTFKVYLPATSEALPSQNPITETEHKGSGAFLLMDDEEIMRDTIGDMLETLGYSVVCKKNGKDAIDYFIAETEANREISGIILDLTTPGCMGGKNAIEQIRTLNAEIPVFLASGYTDDPVMKKPADYGFTASICKPFRKSELSEMLNSYMKKNKAINP